MGKSKVQKTKQNKKQIFNETSGLGYALGSLFYKDNSWNIWNGWDLQSHKEGKEQSLKLGIAENAIFLAKEEKNVKKKGNPRGKKRNGVAPGS